ncbi:ABC transporter substrate-binding protein [Paracoccus pantotrophus]|uniref:ABC transporter substrate-binding protein n=1 Tax=Paracoccus pantotrophus TaxID=82367 RepID=UPI0004666A3A|nr:ABC transporter substrate-binding protein [Paracoccus pantotrophus]RDD97787.1 ABC transporter [Paracoccus pantotrophus]WGR66181.1 ABC transporter [Paracoccus pantotrophus]
MEKRSLSWAAVALVVTGLACAANAQELPERVGITVGTLGNPFFVPLVKGAEDRIADAAPAADVTTVGADYDLNRQSSQIDSFITSGVTLLILNAVDSEAVGPAVKRAKDAGMTVAAVDVTAAGADLTVRTDNVQAGRITCEFLAEQIGGKGDFVIINGPPISSIIDRVSGCREALEAYPDINLLSDNQDGKASRDGGFQVMQGLLTRFPEIDAVFGANDPTAIGAELAARQFNRGEMIIGGVDGSPDFVQALQKEGTLLVASASQDPYNMSWQAADLGLKVMAGEELSETEILLQTELVTQENAAGWQGWDAAR